jgi:hypothetical protein
MGVGPRSSAGRVPLLLICGAVLTVVVPQRAFSAGSSVVAAVPASCRITQVWLPSGGSVDWTPNRCEVVGAK